MDDEGRGEEERGVILDGGGEAWGGLLTRGWRLGEEGGLGEREITLVPAWERSFDDFGRKCLVRSTPTCNRFLLARVSPACVDMLVTSVGLLCLIGAEERGKSSG